MKNSISMKKEKSIYSSPFRRKRSVPDPETEPHLVHGGERAFLYEVIACNQRCLTRGLDYPCSNLEATKCY